MTKYVSVTEAGEKFLRPQPEQYPAAGYVLYQGDDQRWTWLYGEPNVDDSFGPSFATQAMALVSIAEDWEQTGGSAVPRFAGIVRALATKAVMSASS